MTKSQFPITNSQSDLPDGPAGIRNPKSYTGLTLLELLVAITIFAFLCVILAGLVKVSFDLWRGSERLGDITDRRQIILKSLRTDLESIYTEKETREIVKNIMGGEALPDCVSIDEPSFYTDLDSTGNHWLYLVCTDNDKLYEFTSGNIPTKKLIRIMYYLKTEPDGTSALYRVILDKSTALNFFKERRYETGDFPESGSDMVFNDVIYFGLNIRIAGQTRTKWDSLPKDARMLKPSSRENILVVEQTIPQAVEIELVLKPAVFQEPNIILKSDEGDLLKVSYTRGLPTPPEYVKIEDEWCYYNALTAYTIKVEQRGARNTKSASHPANTPVMYGETLKQLLYLTTSGR